MLQGCAHVLFKCTRYRRWWELRGEFEFLQRMSAYRELNGFLTVNESPFSFEDGPTLSNKWIEENHRCESEPVAGK